MADIYHFRVKDQIGSSWSEWFNGLTITCDANGDTLLFGPVEDQAALYGILVKLQNLNLTLIALNRVELDGRPLDRAARV